MTVVVMTPVQLHVLGLEVGVSLNVPFLNVIIP